MDRHELLEEIKRLMNSKGLTPYAVAKNGGMVGSSIYTALADDDSKKCPEVETLEKICKGMGISLSRLFEFAAPDEEKAYLSEDEWKLIKFYRGLSKERADVLLTYLQTFIEMLDKQDSDNN